MKKLFLLLFFISGILFAQTDSGFVKIVNLTDGSVLKGYILTEDSIEIQFKTLSGVETTIEKTQIKEIEDLEGIWNKGEFISTDPNQTRLFFAPTARAVKQGKGYFSAYEIFFPFLAVGLTDFITLSGGVSLFPGAEQQIVYLAPKVRFLHLSTFDLSSGILYAHIDNDDFGIAYGVFTYGTELAALTGGLGWGFINGKYSDKPVIMLGGEARISGSLKILTENWIPPESDLAFISFGLRFFGKSLAADFALVTTTSSTRGFPFVPWIGFAYNF